MNITAVCPYAFDTIIAGSDPLPILVTCDADATDKIKIESTKTKDIKAKAIEYNFCLFSVYSQDSVIIFILLILYIL
jgi:hypothetical protein